jgi:hypothetical protein
LHEAQARARLGSDHDQIGQDLAFRTVTSAMRCPTEKVAISQAHCKQPRR